MQKTQCPYLNLNFGWMQSHTAHSVLAHKCSPIHLLEITAKPSSNSTTEEYWHPAQSIIHRARMTSNHQKSFFSSGIVPQLLWEAVKWDQVCTNKDGVPGTPLLYLASSNLPPEMQLTKQVCTRYTVPGIIIITMWEQSSMTRFEPLSSLDTTLAIHASQGKPYILHIPHCSSEIDNGNGSIQY